MIRRDRRQHSCGAASTWPVRAALLLAVMSLAFIGGYSSRSVAADDDKSPTPGVGADAALEAIPDTARAFVSDYCTRCHNADRREANLDLTNLAYHPADHGNFGLWTKVHDRVALGEMPPEDVKRPVDERREEFVAALAATFVASEKRLLAGEGRAIQRRMNRTEY